MKQINMSSAIKKISYASPRAKAHKTVTSNHGDSHSGRQAAVQIPTKHSTEFSLFTERLTLFLISVGHPIIEVHFLLSATSQASRRASLPKHISRLLWRKRSEQKAPELRFMRAAWTRQKSGGYEERVKSQSNYGEDGEFMLLRVSDA